MILVMQRMHDDIDDDNGDDDGYDDNPYLFHIRFKSAVRADWRCSGCVVTVIIMTVGDAEDAR